MDTINWKGFLLGAFLSVRRNENPSHYASTQSLFETLLHNLKGDRQSSFSPSQEQVAALRVATAAAAGVLASSESPIP